MLFGCPAATFFQFSMAYFTIGINMNKIIDSMKTTERFLLRWVGASSGLCKTPKSRVGVIESNRYGRSPRFNSYTAHFFTSLMQYFGFLDYTF